MRTPVHDHLRNSKGSLWTFPWRIFPARHSCTLLRPESGSAGIFRGQPSSSLLLAGWLDGFAGRGRMENSCSVGIKINGVKNIPSVYVWTNCICIITLRRWTNGSNLIAVTFVLCAKNPPTGSRVKKLVVTCRAQRSQIALFSVKIIFVKHYFALQVVFKFFRWLVSVKFFFLFGVHWFSFLLPAFETRSRIRCNRPRPWEAVAKNEFLLMIDFWWDFEPTSLSFRHYGNIDQRQCRPKVLVILILLAGETDAPLKVTDTPG